MNERTRLTVEARPMGLSIAPMGVDKSAHAFIAATLGSLVHCSECDSLVGFRVNQKQIVCTRAAHVVASFGS